MKENQICKGLIMAHRIHNDNLILLLDMDISGYYEDFTLEKSITMDKHPSGSYIQLMKELRVWNENTNEVDFDRLDGTGVHAYIFQKKSGVFAVGRIEFDQSYYEYCLERERKAQAINDMRERGKV